MTVGEVGLGSTMESASWMARAKAFATRFADHMPRRLLEPADAEHGGSASPDRSLSEARSRY
jgi:hypothetical protein